MAMSEGRWMTFKQLVDNGVVAVSRRTFDDWRRNDPQRFPERVKMGKPFYYRDTDILRWLEGRINTKRHEIAVAAWKAEWGAAEVEFEARIEAAKRWYAEHVPAHRLVVHEGRLIAHNPRGGDALVAHDGSLWVVGGEPVGDLVAVVRADRAGERLADLTYCKVLQRGSPPESFDELLFSAAHFDRYPPMRDFFDD
jgi:predicted DNA-binding transcriptional regulator AlpA